MEGGGRQSVGFKYTDSIQRPGARAQGLGKMVTNTEVSAVSLLQPVERGGEAGRNFKALSSHRGPKLSAVLTHGGSLDFALQTTIHQNTFLFISVLSVLLVLMGGPLLVLVGPYAST